MASIRVENVVRARCAAFVIVGMQKVAATQNNCCTGWRCAGNGILDALPDDTLGNPQIPVDAGLAFPCQQVHMPVIARDKREQVRSHHARCWRWFRVGLIV
ncbi:hypothetical protein D9M70_606220 [compost metagenome]